jgi:hypothetical protein
MLITYYRTYYYLFVVIIIIIINTYYLLFITYYFLFGFFNCKSVKKFWSSKSLDLDPILQIAGSGSESGFKGPQHWKRRKISSYLTDAKEVTPGTLAAIPPLPVLLASFSAAFFSVCSDSFLSLFSFVAVEQPFGLFPCLDVALADFLTAAFWEAEREEEDFAFSGEQRRGVDALTDGDRRVGVTPFLRAGRAGRVGVAPFWGVVDRMGMQAVTPPPSFSLFWAFWSFSCWQWQACRAKKI